MADAVFPLPVAEVISTLAELFRHQGRGEAVELLDNANADVDLTDYDTSHAQHAPTPAWNQERETTRRVRVQLLTWLN